MDPYAECARLRLAWSRARARAEAAEARAERAEYLVRELRLAVNRLQEYVTAYDPETREDVEELLAPLVDAELAPLAREASA